MARMRVLATAGCSGLIRNSSAPDSMPATSFSVPWTLVVIRIGISCVRRSLFKQMAELRSAHFGHHQIDHHQVDFFALQNAERRRRPRGFQNPIGGRLQHGLQQAAIQLDIVDDQNRGSLRGVLEHALPARQMHLRTQHNRVVRHGLS